MLGICFFLSQSKANDEVLVPQLSCEDLRAFNPGFQPSTSNQKATAKYAVCFLTNANKEGVFRLQIAENANQDTYSKNISNEDDGVMVIIAHPKATNYYFKFTRIVEKYINAKWFGAGNNSRLITTLSSQEITSFKTLFDKYSPYENSKSNVYNNIESRDAATQHWENNTVDWVALQTAINYCVYSKTDKHLFIPRGKYYISRELFIHNAISEKNYGQCQISIEGETSFSGIDGTDIICNFNNKFALGMQEAKGIKIKGLGFQGQFLRDKKIAMSNRDFFSSSLEREGANSYNRFFYNCLDKRFACYAAIVIDPFRTAIWGNDTIKNFVDFYEDLKPFYYKRIGTSTGTEIEDVQINGFVAGIVFSPNGMTQGDELNKIEKAKFANVKYGICFSQDQEKTNTIRHIFAWENVHTFIASSSQTKNISVAYGQGRAGNQIIEDVNIAGNMNQFIYREDGGTFATYIKNVYSESLGKIGYLGSQVGGTFEDSQLAFYFPASDEQDTTYEGFYPDCHLKGYGYTFKNCLIRYYGNTREKLRWPISINGSFKFENCVFTTVPFYSQSNGDGIGLCSFINCGTTLEGSFGVDGIKSASTSHFFQNVAYGNFILHNYIADRKGKTEMYHYIHPYPYQDFGIEKITINSIKANGDIVLEINGDNKKNYYDFSKLVVYCENSYGPYSALGILKNSKNRNDSKLIIAGVQQSMLNKTIYIKCILPVTTIVPFIGDIKAGKSCTKIFNIRNDRVDNTAKNYVDYTQYIGKVILLPSKNYSANNKNENKFSNNIGYAIIKSYDATSNSFETTPFNVDKDLNDVYFCNGCEKINE